MCTRVIYTPAPNQSYIGRNMDWGEPPATQLWAVPAGVTRKAMAKSPRQEEYSWVSQFPSVVVSNYDVATSDGLNSEGLTANLLWLARSEFPRPATQGDKYPMSMSIWAQFLLDTCATVADTLMAMRDIYIQTAVIPGTGREANCHLSVGDREGNSAVFEYVNGQMHTYSNVEVDDAPGRFFHYTKDEMRVMTNDPEFNRQLESLAYWDELNAVYQGGCQGVPALLPGSNLALNRFVRATYYTNQLTNQSDSTKNLAQLAAVMDNAAQPGVLGDQGSADLSRTQYSSFADAATGQYFYRSGYSPFLIWINLEKVPFDELEAGKVFHLELDEDGNYKGMKNFGHGNVTKHLEQDDMFPFLPA